MWICLIFVQQLCQFKNFARHCQLHHMSDFQLEGKNRWTKVSDDLTRGKKWKISAWLCPMIFQRRSRGDPEEERQSRHWKELRAESWLLKVAWRTTARKVCTDVSSVIALSLPAKMVGYWTIKTGHVFILRFYYSHQVYIIVIICHSISFEVSVLFPLFIFKKGKKLDKFRLHCFCEKTKP